tara:strand:+ start:2542 stop:3093 length:552 start_codon:yes stop_codon:yes gene_type:complete
MKRIINLPREEVKLFKSLDSNLTYGELTKSGAIQLIGNINNKNVKSFCDLGSGIGVVCKYMCEYLPTLEIIHGIELSEERYNESLNLIKSIKNRERRNKIKLFNGDLMKIDVSDYDIIYISNLCFNHTFNINLSNKLNNEVKNNSVVFASQDLAFKRTVIKSTFPINQSWGNHTQIYKYEIIE